MNSLPQNQRQDFVQWFLKHRHNNDSLDSYHDQAIYVQKPGNLILGKQDISEALQNALEHSHTCGDNIIIENGDVALVLSKLYPNTSGSPTGGFVEAKRAIHVFKKSDEGVWKCVVDNMFGTDLLDYV